MHLHLNISLSISLSLPLPLFLPVKAQSPPPSPQRPSPLGSPLDGSNQLNVSIWLPVPCFPSIYFRLQTVFPHVTINGCWYLCHNSSWATHCIQTDRGSDSCDRAVLLEPSGQQAFKATQLWKQAEGGAAPYGSTKSAIYAHFTNDKISSEKQGECTVVREYCESIPVLLTD